jgi:hypothetical protein
MDQVLKVFFRHQDTYYSAYVTIVHQFETDFIFVEFLDEDMIYNFQASYLSYVGKKGVKELDAYQSIYLRPILRRVEYIIKNAQQMCKESDGEIPNEEFIRQN